MANGRFHLRVRRMRRLSVLGSVWGHLLAITLLVSSAAELARLAGVRAGHRRQPAGQPHQANAAGYMQMVDFAPQAPAAAPGRRFPPDFYRRLMRRGIKDTRGMSLAELQRRLQALSGQAAGISDTSLMGIGKLLGLQPGRYKVRTSYRDELNPNLNFHHARVVRASRLRTHKGGTGYRLTLRDRERDEFTFTIAADAAREFERGGLAFKDKLLTPTATGPVFQLEGARVTAIANWQAREDPAGRGGSIVTLRDRAGNQRRFHVRGGPDTPLVMARLAFVRRPDGSYLYDPESEATVFTNLIDTSSLTLWSVNRAKSAKPGEERARVVMLDGKGNRMIYFVKGKEAREMLARAGVLDPKSVTGRIYRKTGLAGYLLDMYKKER